MTCLEAQSNIMAFIDKKLPDDKVTDFVRHMKTCKNCSEELEIYYTLIVGTRQLDNNEELSRDFKKALEDDLEKAKNKVNKAKGFKISTFGIIFIAFVIFIMFVYGRILSKVYTIEQLMISNKQTEYYFKDELQGYISFDDKDIILEINRDNEANEKSLYDSIKLFNMKNYYYPFSDGIKKEMMEINNE